MTKIRLSDLQLLLLSTAATRADRSLLPPSDSLGELSDRLRSAMAALLRQGFAEKIDGASDDRLWRIEGDRRIGLVITPAGLAAIGIDESDPAMAMAAPPEPTPAVLGAITKIGTVVALLRRDDGATLAELVATTGWLPHTTRAALTGLRKKGHVIAKDRRDDATCYHIAAAA